jgi:hypothetical protein
MGLAQTSHDAHPLFLIKTRKTLRSGKRPQLAPRMAAARHSKPRRILTTICDVPTATSDPTSAIIQGGPSGKGGIKMLKQSDYKHRKDVLF